MKKLIILFIIFISIASPVKAGEALTAVTENQIPYSHEEGGQVKGVATAVVKAVMRKVSIKATFKIYPWTRAYKMALEETNVLIYPIVKTPERTPLFKWVGEIAPVTIYIIKLQTRTDIQLTTLADVKPYTVGCVRGWASTAYLSKKGIRTEEVTESAQNVKKLKTGRIDLPCTPQFTFLEDIKRLGYTMSDFEFV